MNAPPEVVVAVAPSREIAEMWAELLAEESIAYRLTPADTGDTGLVPSLASWEVRVAATDATRALDLVPSTEAGDLDEDGGDAAEGEDFEDQPIEESSSAAGDRAMLRLMILVIAVVIALLIVFYGARSFG